MSDATGGMLEVSNIPPFSFPGPWMPYKAGVARPKERPTPPSILLGCHPFEYLRSYGHVHVGMVERSGNRPAIRKRTPTISDFHGSVSRPCRKQKNPYQRRHPVWI